jgi:hypothetical protein
MSKYARRKTQRRYRRRSAKRGSRRNATGGMLISAVGGSKKNGHGRKRPRMSGIGGGTFALSGGYIGI